MLGLSLSQGLCARSPGVSLASLRSDVSDLGPIAWYDAADLSTITESSGLVSQWDDVSGNGNTLTQASGATQPTTGATTQNGRNVLDFSGAQYLGRADALGFTGNPALSIVVIAIPTDDNSRAVNLGNDGVAGENIALRPSDLSYRFNNGNVVYDPDGQTTDGSTCYVDCFIRPASGNYVSSLMYRNATALSQSSSSNGTNTLTLSDTSFRVGAGYATNGTPTDYMTGSIGEILAFDKALSASEVSTIQAYAARKWGL